jgi:hypothetical protein
LHDLLTGEVSIVNAVGYKEDDDEEEEGFVNMAEVEYGCENNEGCRMQDDSWLDMEEQCGILTYHVNVVVEDEDDDEGPEEDRAVRETTTSLENKCVALRIGTRRKAAMTTFGTGKERMTFRTM